MYKNTARLLGGRNYSSSILMSNCISTQSEREKVLADVGRMMPVDVFGGCGKYPPNSKDGGNKDESEGIISFKNFQFFNFF